MVVTIKKRVLYPEKNRYVGEIVAEGYIYEKSERPFYKIRCWSESYYAYICNIKGIDIRYDNTTLRRLQRKINKKEKQGYLTYEQGVKIILSTVCNMVEEQLKGTFL